MALIPCSRCGEQLDAVAQFCGACGAQIRDPNLARVVAGRYVLRERIGSGSLGERFRREGEVLCRLKSPHTVTTFEFDQEPDGSLYIAMEIAQGTSLWELLHRECPLPWRRAMRIIAGLCDSLGEAHELGIVHRDLRPQNVLVEQRNNHPDFVKVLDFGLAKILQAPIALSPVGQTVGSIEFSSPEQLQSRSLDGRTDIYALGILGYLMVTGVHPLAEARTYGDLVDAHLHRKPLPASVLRPMLPPDVDEILARCLAKQPEQRYPTAGALAASIGVALETNPGRPQSEI